METRAAPEAMPPAALARAIGICARIHGVLSLLARGATSGRLVAHGCAPGSFAGNERLELAVDGSSLECPALPRAILDLLEAGWHVRASPAVMDARGREPQALTAAFGRFILPPHFGRPDGETSGRYYVEPEDRASSLDRQNRGTCEEAA